MKNYKTPIKIFSFIIGIILFGYISAYAEVEPFDMDEVLKLEDSIPLDSQANQNILNDAFERSNGRADAYTWDASGLNDYGYDPYALDYELSALADYQLDDYYENLDFFDGDPYAALDYVTSSEEYEALPEMISEEEEQDRSNLDFFGNYLSSPAGRDYYQELRNRGVDSSASWRETYNGIEAGAISGKTMEERNAEVEQEEEERRIAEVLEPYEDFYDKGVGDDPYLNDYMHASLEWLQNEHAGKPSIIFSQDRIDKKFTENDTSGIIEKWSPYNDESRPARPYIDTSPLYVEASKHVKGNTYGNTGFIYGGNLRKDIVKAMVDQGFKLDKNNTDGLNKVLDSLGPYQAPTIGYKEVETTLDFLDHGSTTSYGNPYPGYPQEKPQITIAKPKGDDSAEFIAISEQHNILAAKLAHELEHSSQLDPQATVFSDSQSVIPINPELAKRMAEFLPHTPDNSKSGLGPEINKFPLETPAVLFEIGTLAAAFREQTGKPLDLTITFPSGKDVSVAWIESQLRQKHVITADPETGKTYTVTELMTTPVGLEWFGSLFGEDKLGVYTDSNDPGDNNLTPGAKEIFEASPEASAFLEQLGIDY